MLPLLAIVGLSLAEQDQEKIILVQQGPVNKPEEYCELPRHYVGFAYSKKDRKKEERLCRYNFYKKRGDRTKGQIVGVCPKILSTNPALELFDLPKGTSKKEFEAIENCRLTSKDTKKVAKFKQSRSCSYAPSILAYYHFSRALGNILKVPQAVYRTMDKEAHKEKAKMGAKIGRGICKKTWRNFYSIHRKNSWKKQRFKLLTKEGQLFGALSVNPRGERKYKRFNGRGSASKSDTFAAPVLATKTHKYLLKNKPIGAILPRSIQGSVQTITAMRDLSHMYLVDHILSQSDRFGNVHARNYWYYIDEEDGELKRTASKPNEGFSGEPIKVKEMMLKDNDCGIVKTNHIRNTNVLEQIRHFDPHTYARLGWLDSIYSTEAFQDFLKEDLHFEPKDTKRVGRYLKEAWKTLKKNCLNGRLNLDLDIKAHLNGSPGIKNKKEQCKRIYKPQKDEKLQKDE